MRKMPPRYCEFLKIFSRLETSNEFKKPTEDNNISPFISQIYGNLPVELESITVFTRNYSGLVRSIELVDKTLKLLKEDHGNGFYKLIPEQVLDYLTYIGDSFLEVSLNKKEAGDIKFYINLSEKLSLSYWAFHILRYFKDLLSSEELESLETVVSYNFYLSCQYCRLVLKGRFDKIEEVVLKDKSLRGIYVGVLDNIKDETRIDKNERS
jgi:hypothetical protein